MLLWQSYSAQYLRLNSHICKWLVSRRFACRGPGETFGLSSPVATRTVQQARSQHGARGQLSPSPIFSLPPTPTWLVYCSAIVWNGVFTLTCKLIIAILTSKAFLNDQLIIDQISRICSLALFFSSVYRMKYSGLRNYEYSILYALRT